jgi:hypothetical protein
MKKYKVKGYNIMPLRNGRERKIIARIKFHSVKILIVSYSRVEQGKITKKREREERTIGRELL